MIAYVKQQDNYHWLDLIRGISALAVFSGHLRVICFKDYAIQDLPFFGKLFFFITGFGHESVVMFFVISGFFIIKSIHESHKQNYWSTAEYSNNRITRLWVVLLPALVIGFTLDKLGLEYFSDSLAYSNKIRYFTADINSKLHYTSALGNAFFLQTLTVPTLGSNGSLWSLSNEFWYYVLFPLFYFSVVKRYNIIVRIILCIAGIIVLISIGEQMIFFFIIWLMGGISYFFTKRKNTFIFNRYINLFFLIVIFMSILLLIRFKHLPFYFNDYTLALTFSLLIPLLVKQTMNNTYLRNSARYLSNISYTLYLVHLPFIFFTTSYLYFQNEPWHTNNFFVFLGLNCLTIIYATIMWFLFERNTPIIKNYITNFLINR